MSERTFKIPSAPEVHKRLQARVTAAGRRKAKAASSAELEKASSREGARRLPLVDAIRLEAWRRLFHRDETFGLPLVIGSGRRILGRVRKAWRAARGGPR